MKVNSLSFVFKALVFSICLGLIIWQSYACLQKYLQFHLNTDVKFVKNTEINFPVFIVCPAYPVAYKGNMLNKFGIGSSDDYRKGNWKGNGNSSLNEKEIFDEVTHDIEDIFERIVIRFDDMQPNKDFSGQDLKNMHYTLKLHLTYGQCFEVDIESYDGGKSQIQIFTKMPVYIFVKQAGQFFENSRSRLEIQLGKCLYIEMAYEVFIQNMNAGCTPAKPDICNCLNYDVDLTYDDCTEGAVETNMIDRIKCVVPFLRSNKTVCNEKGDIKQVLVLNLNSDTHHIRPGLKKTRLYKANLKNVRLSSNLKNMRTSSN